MAVKLFFLDLRIKREKKNTLISKHYCLLAIPLCFKSLCWAKPVASSIFLLNSVDWERYQPSCKNPNVNLCQNLRTIPLKTSGIKKISLQKDWKLSCYGRWMEKAVLLPRWFNDWNQCFNFGGFFVSFLRTMTIKTYISVAKTFPKRCI